MTRTSAAPKATIRIRKLSARANQLHQDGLSEVSPQGIDVLCDGVRSARQAIMKGKAS
jgi:hypothetical protein